MGGAGHRQHHRCHLSDHRRGVRTHARRVTSRHRPGRRRRAGGIRQRPVAQLDAGGTRRRHRRALAGAAEARRPDRRGRHQRERRPGPTVVRGAGLRGHDGPRRLRRHRAYLPLERRARWCHGPEGGGAPGAGGRVRRHHAVERPAVHHGDEARAVSRVGLDDGAQAGTGDVARPVPARRCRARSRPSARRGEHRRRIARGERAHRHAPRRRQGQLHRVDQ